MNHSHPVCNLCGGKGCEKCHNGWECTGYTCNKCAMGWELGVDKPTFSQKRSSQTPDTYD